MPLLLPFELKAAAGLALIVALLLGLHLWISSIKREATAVCQASYQAAALKAEEAARTEEQRRTVAQSEIVNESQRLATRASSDRSLATDAAARLRERAAARSGQPACHPQAAPGSAAAADAPGVPADVLGRCGEAVGLFAAIADQRGIRGAACERINDSLTVPTP